MSQIASRGQLRMSFLRYALVTVPAILLLGTLSGRLSGSGYGNEFLYIIAAVVGGCALTGGAGSAIGSATGTRRQLAERSSSLSRTV